MTRTADAVTAAVADLRRDCGVPVDPARRGPVLLLRFFEETMLLHFALPHLTRGAVAAHLRRPDVGVGCANEPLAGFVFVAGRAGRAYVSATDILPRRRYTAAHELGHFVLHRDRMGGQFHGDTDKTILETTDDAETIALEREANRFAAELLMPSEVCEARADELWRAHRCCPRTVLANQLASELLVSGEAMRYRLRHLRLGDE
jgi:hypothetical protein